MQDPALSQQLKVLALCGAGLLLAAFLGAQIGHENYGQLLLGAVIIFVACIALFSGRSFWVLTIASSFLGGTFPILRAAFTPFQILMAIGVAKFLVGDVVLRRTRLRLGDRFDTLMIAGFMGVLTWHGVHDRFGMRFLGSTIWGGHHYVNVYVGLAAFFVVQSIPTKSKLWAKLPYLVLAVATFDLLIGVITTVSPASIYIIFPFYSAVSSAGFEEVVTGTSLDMSYERIGAFGNFGFVLILIVLASIRLTRLLHPQNFFRVLCLIAGFVAALFSGFRSAVINAIIGFFTAGIRDLKYGVIALLPIFAAILFALSFVNSQIFHLPRQIQRGLAFFPGAWDSDMAKDAKGSNDFRKRVWTTWAKEYFPEQPWLGRGFGFKSQWAKGSVYKYNPNWDRQTVETGNIHNGLFAALDTFGIIGTIFFIIWNLRLLARALRLPFGKNDPEGVALRFLALYLAVWIISYWFGALNVGTFLPIEFALAGVFLRLKEAIASEESSQDAESLDKPQPGAREELATA
jgi:O-antigen ligase/polysaccharide polymerase Wzy-like membrane protein